MSEIIPKFGYVLSSKTEYHKPGMIIRSPNPYFPDESKINAINIQCPKIEYPGEVIFLGLGTGSKWTEELNFLIVQLTMEKTVLNLWDNIEELLIEAGFEERIDEILTENEEPIRKLRAIFKNK